MKQQKSIGYELLQSLTGKIIVWDNDGTIMGTHDPNDTNSANKIILPGVRNVMTLAKLNYIISGFKSPESESQNYDVDKIVERFTTLMNKLPVKAALFSPKIGGVECYLLHIEENNEMKLIKAHEDSRYFKLIGQFKKPGIGMFQVLSDFIELKHNIKIDAQNAIMVGDTWHDEKAAQSFGLPFIEAKNIHALA